MNKKSLEGIKRRLKMENCLGIVTLGRKDNNFGVLCRKRPDAMLPFAGRYRLIDIALSNMVNGGVSGIGLFTGNKIRSLMDHVRNGKVWDLNRNANGIKLYPPLYDNDPLYQKSGDINEFKKNEKFFIESKADNLFFSTTSMVANINLSKAYNEFRKSKADISLIYKREDNPSANLIGCKQITCDGDKKIKSVGMYIGKNEKTNIYLEMFFIKKRVFFEILNEAIERGNELYFQEAMLDALKGYDTRVYEFDGSILYINDVKSYYDANMKVLDVHYAKELFYKNGQMITKPKDEPPTYYRSSAKVKNSYIANGCKIDGIVENSIIFRGVNIETGSIIKNSIIMQESVISEGAHIEYTILDKHVVVKPNVMLIGNPSIPYVIGKGESISNEINHFEDNMFKSIKGKELRTAEEVI